MKFEKVRIKNCQFEKISLITFDDIPLKSYN